MDFKNRMKEIIVALATPFNKASDINFSVLDLMIEKNMSEGATGFFVGGSAGEGLLLTLEERMALIAYLASYTKRIKMIANVSAPSAKEANLLAKKAEENGYAAISSVVPYYYKHTMPAIAAYYNAVMEACKLPMLIYNFPGNTGTFFDLGHPAIIALLNHPKILGTKHTNRDLFELERMMRINPDLNYYNGYDETFLNALPMGIKGAIGSTFNITTPIFVDIARHYEAGEMGRAMEKQRQANIVMDALIEVGLIAGIKYAYTLLGMPVGEPRLPFLALDEAQKQRIKNVTETYLKKA